MVNHTTKTQIPQSLTAGVFNGRGIFDFGAKNEAYADYFTGTSYLALLNLLNKGKFAIDNQLGNLGQIQLHDQP